VLPTLLVIVLVIAAAVAARRWVRPPHPVSPRDQVDAFTRARAVTNRWSDDPQATPAPLKAYLAEQAKGSHDTSAPEESQG
jgi:hypothetical protein